MVANFEETNNQCVNFYNSELYTWKGLKFRSKSEIKIAEELDRRGIFFLPNCAGRIGSKHTRKNVEADFLICYEGVWAVIEVDGEEYHRNKRKDIIRDSQLCSQQLTVIRVPANICYERPKDVVDALLSKIPKKSKDAEDRIADYWNEQLNNIKNWEDFFHFWHTGKTLVMVETFCLISSPKCENLLDHWNYLELSYQLKGDDVKKLRVDKYIRETTNVYWREGLLRETDIEWLSYFGNYSLRNPDVIEDATINMFKLAYQKCLMSQLTRGEHFGWKKLFKECDKYKIMISDYIWFNWVEDGEKHKCLHHLVFSASSDGIIKPSGYEQKMEEIRGLLTSTKLQDFKAIDALILKWLNGVYGYSTSMNDPLMIELIKLLLKDSLISWDLNTSLPPSRRAVIQQMCLLYRTDIWFVILFHSRKWLDVCKEDIIKYLQILDPKNEKMVAWLSSNPFKPCYLVGRDTRPVYSQ